MGVLAIIRVVYFQFGMDFVSGTWVQKVVLVLAIYTVFMGSMLAYKENVLKKRLAYSTVSQVSYILFGLMLLSPDGFRGAMLQLVYHAIAKNGLFLVAGALVFYVHRTKATQMRGMGKLLPVTMWVFALCSLSLIGIPPTGGFVSKWFLAQGGLEFGVLGIVGVAVLMISALLTAGYLLPIVTTAFFPGDDFDYKKLESYVFHTSWRMRVPMLILAAAVLLLGIFPNALDWLIDPVQLMLFT
jgi:multicomponent Na+:H+ antiporter subunit D